MIFLTPVESLRLTLSTAADVDYVASYVDTGTDPLRVSKGSHSTASAVEIVAAPSTGSRLVKSLYICNTSSASNVVTLTVYNGATDYRVCRMTLEPDQTLTMDEAGINVTEIPGSVVVTDSKNKIINGNFNIWQRGTSIATPVAAGTYLADRFKYDKSGAMEHAMSQSTDVPAVSEIAPTAAKSKYSLLLDCTTIDAAIAAGDYTVLYYYMEGFDFLAIAQRTFTLSFWVKATKTGTYCVSFRNSGNDRCYVAEYTVDVTATWEKKTITVPASPSGGTWDYTTGTGLLITWAIAAGSTYHTTANSWITSGPFVATANQVNGVDSTSNDFRLSQIQVELGSQVTPFDVVNFQTEISRCQRYYEKTYALDTPPGSTTDNGPLYAASSGTLNWAVSLNWRFKAKKRIVPTVSPYNPTTGTINEIRNASAGTNLSADASPVGMDGCVIRNLAASTDQNIYLGHAVANADF